MFAPTGAAGWSWFAFPTAQSTPALPEQNSLRTRAPRVARDCSPPHIEFTLGFLVFREMWLCGVGFSGGSVESFSVSGTNTPRTLALSQAVHRRIGFPWQNPEHPSGERPRDFFSSRSPPPPTAEPPIRPAPVAHSHCRYCVPLRSRPTSETLSDIALSPAAWGRRSRIRRTRPLSRKATRSAVRGSPTLFIRHADQPFSRHRQVDLPQSTPWKHLAATEAGLLASEGNRNPVAPLTTTTPGSGRCSP